MTEEEKRKARKRKITNYIIYSIAALIFVGAMYFIFAPEKTGSETVNGLNPELPAAEEEQLPSSKAKAYEELEYEQLINNQMQSLDLYGDEFSLPTNSAEEGERTTGAKNNSEDAAFAAANAALEGLSISSNADLDVSKRNEIDRLRQQVSDLESKSIDQEGEIRLLKASEEMHKAALQQANGTPGAGAQAEQSEASSQNTDEADKEAQATVMPITDGVNGIATSLNRGSARRSGFFGIGSTRAQKNTIKASIYGRQIISDGQNVRLRLSEPMIVAGQVVPVGAILVGTSKIGVDRLLVSIHSVEHQDIITSVALEVFDTDGQQGIFLPGSAEMEAGREIGADVARAVGSSASSNVAMFTQQSAAEQIKADVGRGIVQGTFNYLGKKLSEIKVTVQDKHRVYLVPQKQ